MAIIEKDNQYHADRLRLAELLQGYTGIPLKRLLTFISENPAAEILSCSNELCSTEAERHKLAALFEFKRLYETLKDAGESRTYRFTCPRDAKVYFQNFFADTHDREYFAVAFLDANNQVISTKTLFAGTVDYSFVSIREVIKEALFQNAVSVVLAHNHPSGNTAHSDNDLTITRRLKLALRDVGIRLYDHIIVGRDKAESMVDLGLFRGTETRTRKTSEVALCEQVSGYIAASSQSSLGQRLEDAKKHLATERTISGKEKAGQKEALRPERITKASLLEV